MWKHLLAALVGLTLLLDVCRGQTVEPARNEGTYLGLLFAPLTEDQYKQLQQLKRGQGVRVTQVLPNSPAAKAKLLRDDIVLAYNGEKVRDCIHFAKLIQNDEPTNKVKLTILRDGKERTVETALTLGPALRIAPSKPETQPGDEPKGVAKPTPPASVCVAAAPLDEGKMKVTIEFYAEGTGKIRTVVCEGQQAEIDSVVEKLPQRERDAVRLALQRIRNLTNPKPPDSKKP